MQLLLPWQKIPNILHSVQDAKIPVMQIFIKSFLSVIPLTAEFIKFSWITTIFTLLGRINGFHQDFQVSPPKFDKRIFTG